MPSQSAMLPLGTRAPDFTLPDPTTGRRVGLREFDTEPALLVAFICNHCPFVKHIGPELARLALDYAPRGLAVVAINANDAERYVDDSPERMRAEKTRVGYPFPYLFDAGQEVAKAYRAVCTPDFFLFDQHRVLGYRGRFDASTPGNGKPVTGEDLRAAIEAVLAERIAPAEQFPVGCGIKWKPGNEPDYL